MDDYDIGYGRVILWSAIAAGLIGGAFGLRGHPDFLWLALALVVIGLVAGIGALAELVFYFMRGYARNLRDVNEAKARTPEVIRMETAAKLTEWQAAIIRSGQMLEDWAPMLEGPLKNYTLTFDDKSMMRVPTDFAVDYLEQAGDIYLAPTSQYSDSHRRQWANSIVNWLCEKHFAIPPQGNLAASWQKDGRANALQAFGLEEA